MRTRFMLAAAFAAAVLLPGAGSAVAESPPPPEAAGLDVRVFTIHHRSVDDAGALVRDHLGPLGSYTVHPSLKTITVEDEEDTLAAIARVLAAFDVAPPEVQLTIQLIRASEREDPPDSLAAEIRHVESSLRDLTRWAEFRRVGSVSLRVAEGAEVEAQLPRTPYRVEFGVDQVQKGAGRVRLSPFRLLRDRRGEGGELTTTKLFGVTGMNLSDNRLVTVGATQSERSPEALFVTVTAKVED